MTSLEKELDGLSDEMIKFLYGLLVYTFNAGLYCEYDGNKVKESDRSVEEVRALLKTRIKDIYDP